MSELLPPHAAMLVAIADLANNLRALEKLTKESIVPEAARLAPDSLEMTRLQYIGGLCHLLRTFERMAVSIDDLEGVIETLRAVGQVYRHDAIDHTAEVMEQRRRQPHAKV